ncbi:MAG: phosphomethylpyrimidine kinase [Dehalococcoidia bacterium]|nr:phosphomethylpyrimidine kinase [Dehalococcoidia bacterium]
MRNKEMAEKILGNVTQAMDNLRKCKDFACLMPEVRVNIVYAMPGAKTGKQVAAIEGRITVVNGFPYASGLPKWGASDHMARLVIEARKYNKSVNAGINFKCDKTIIKIVKEYARGKKLRFGWIDRTREPDDAADIDGMSIPWKVKYLIEQNGAVPDLFYEGDGWGKEPLFFALGSDALSVASVAGEIAAKYKKAIASKA